MVNQEYYNLGTAPSVIRQLFAYGLEQAAKVGADKVYDYSLGNPSIPAPKKVNESIKKIVDEMDSIKLHGYSMAAGFDTARAAVAKDLAERFGLDVKASELFFTCGAAPALISIIKALIVDADSEIMAVAPFFPEYRPFVNANGGKLVVVPADTKAFQIHLDEVEKRITKNTQGIIINSPNNPSGVVYTEETLKGLAALLERKSKEYGHPIYIIADEPYRELVYGGVKVPFIPCLYKNTIVCYSYSKSLSLPGERMGYVAANPKCRDAELISAICGQISRGMGHNCPPSIIQMAVAEVVDLTADMSVYETNMNLLYQELTALGFSCVKPGGTFYIFPKALEEDATAFCQKALRYDLVLVPSDSFGVPGYFRMAYCIDTEKVERSLEALRRFVKENY